jgi:hypothetical protein
MKHERPKNYPHYRRNTVSDEAFNLALHFGASPKEIQKALDKRQAQLPQTRK